MDLTDKGGRFLRFSTYVPTNHDEHDRLEVCFWISDVPIVMSRRSSTSVFCEGLGRALFTFCCVKMVLIDSASSELSIGCHIVNFDYKGPLL